MQEASIGVISVLCEIRSERRSSTSKCPGSRSRTIGSWTS
jgi:hypothetical protein